MEVPVHTKLMENNQFHLDLKGCIKNKGIVCIPVPELIKLFEKYPYLIGKDFKGIMEKAKASDRIQEVNEDGETV